jgi:hypothetical protein
MQILSGASGLLGSCASCLFRTSFMQSLPFPTEYHDYGDTAWTYQNLAEVTLAFHPDPAAQFKIHDLGTPRIVDKVQIYSLIDQLANHLPIPLTQIIPFIHPRIFSNQPHTRSPPQILLVVDARCLASKTKKK